MNQYGDNYNNSSSQEHPLQSHSDSSSRYPPSQQPSNDFYPNNSPSISDNHHQQQLQQQQGGYYQPTPQQLEQLHLQKQHQMRIQEQMAAADSIRSEQHRVARPTASNALQDPRTPLAEQKPASYYAYPPQFNASSSNGQDQEPTTLKSRLTRLVQFPCSTYGKALMTVIALEALLVIIIQTVIVVKYFQALRDSPVIDYDNPSNDSPPYLDTNNSSRAIPAYLIVFVFAQLFQFVLAWDAVRAQNTIEMIGIVIFNLCCFAYSIFEISQTRDSLDRSASFFYSPADVEVLKSSLTGLLYAVVAIIGLSQCLVTWLAYQLFQEFGWKIYKKIGADPNTKKMYRAYQIYLVLIKVDLFFFVGFSIQFIYLTLTNRSADPEYWLSIIVLPITIVLLYIAVYAVRHESRRWMSFFIVAMLCGVAYFVFKVVRMYFGDKVNRYIGIKNFLTLFAALCLVTILVTIANAAVCYRNFGKGLKTHLMKDHRDTQNSTSSTGGRVLEID
ncbi:hypothetical protein BGZ83_004117 [Gryganskiella cystojenkinii]|nr:hypothetical protein BGZ83_004117 [Gryganskiella cystojenkinii]